VLALRTCCDSMHEDIIRHLLPGAKVHQTFALTQLHETYICNCLPGSQSAPDFYIRKAALWALPLAATANPPKCMRHAWAATCVFHFTSCTRH
jgi:hypothetical protein